MTDNLDSTDRKIVLATQDGLPLAPNPYERVSRQTGIPVAEIKARMTAMLDSGSIRRIGVVPNHYALGFTANGMSVWDVDDDKVDELGEQVAALAYVSHCYQRPRKRPLWPYNLFAMVHGSSRREVEEKVSAIAAILGSSQRRHDILYSTKILKKTGLRLLHKGDT
jgi:DNA-binding Lrp family transcriptional regulator